MQYNVEGWKLLDFVSKEGQSVKGLKLYVTCKEDGVIGLMTDSLFIRDGIEIPKDLKVGETVEIVFNRKGKPEGVYKIR